MAPSPSPALVITDGSLAGLLACWTEGVCARGLTDADTPAPIGWFPAFPSLPPLPRRLAAAQRQLDFCHLADLIIWDDPADCAEHAAPAGFRLTRMLLAATTEAARRGLHRVVWPAHAGGPTGDAPDLDAIAAICNRALLVSQLAELDLPVSSSTAPIVIETPYADFSDRQLAELALDLDAPLGPPSAAWWCLGAAERPCARCEACRRWDIAFDSVYGGPAAESGPHQPVTIPPRPPTTDNA